MRTFLLLFTRTWFYTPALVLTGGAAFQLGRDPRLGMMMMGVVCVLAGAGQALLAREQRSCLHKGTAAFLILFGLFSIASMAVMLATGERI